MFQMLCGHEVLPRFCARFLFIQSCEVSLFQTPLYLYRKEFEVTFFYVPF